MVFERILAEVLNRFLGSYVKNFDSSQLQVGIWSGDVTLKHLDVKESALDELDLPVQVVSGHLGQLVMKIPWKNMYASPVEATIEGLYVLVIPNLAVKYDAEKEEKAAEQAKQAELQRIEEAKAKQAEKSTVKEEKKDTFTEKLVTQIVKNLQVKIKDIHIRYEDSISDRSGPFSVGFTLHNLSFETTDEKWAPKIITETVNIIHKLITLDSFAVYWNSECDLLSLKESVDRQMEMEKIIASSNYMPSRISYMLGPINSTAKLKLHTKPECDDFQIPKVWLNVVMDEIAVGLSKQQYQNLMKLLESFDRMTVATLYRKYRPDAPHKGHAKEWWRFAIIAILEEDIRRKKRNWSWKHMQEHRKFCKTYKNVYISKLAGKKLTAEMMKDLSECEKFLDIFNITVVRGQAELELLRNPKVKEQKPKSMLSWIGGFGWFSAAPPQQEGSTTEKNIVQQFEEAMTQEEKNKLYEAIGYHEQHLITEYPKEFVENKLLFQLDNLTLSLTDDTKRNSQVLKTNLKNFSASVEQRPSAQAICIDAKVKSFVIHGAPYNIHGAPSIAIPQEKKGTDSHLLTIVFETNPLDKSCDHRLQVNAEPLEIIYDALTINELVEVFHPPDEITLQQLQATAMLKLEEMKETSALGLQYAIEQHKYLDLKIDFQPTFFIIPENGIYDENAHLLIFSLGNIKMDSLKRESDIPTVRELFKAGSTEDEVLTTMIDKAYDKFHIEIKNTEMILTGPKEDWRSIVGCHDVKQHLLQPVTVKFDFHKSIVGVDPHVPKMKLSGELPVLDLCLSDHQLLNILKIVMSIPFPESEKAPPPPDQFKSKLTSDYINLNAKAVQEAKREAVMSVKPDTSQSDDESTVSSSSSTSAQCTEVEVKFEITKFQFTFFRCVDSERDKMLKFSFSQFGTCLIQRTFDLEIDIYLGGMFLEHFGYRTRSDDLVTLLSTPVNETDEYLFTLEYRQADKKGPDFATLYNSTLQKINILVRDIIVILHQEAILSIIHLSSTLLLNIEALDRKSKVSAITSEGIASVHKEEESKEVIKERLVSKRKKTETEIIDLNLRATLDSIRIVVCDVSYTLTDICVKGMNSVVVLRKTKTVMQASLKNLIVTDPSNETVYPKILSTVAGEVLGLNVVLYNNATDDENYANMAAVDMEVEMNFGRIVVVYLNKFVASLLFFLDHFQMAKEKMAEASAVAAEAAKHGMEQAYAQSSRINLKICIQAPVIIVPQNSASKNSVIADLGILKISNKFEMGFKRNELGLPAIFDNMELDLQNLQISRATVDTKTCEIISECLLLEPISFRLSVLRNLSSDWYIDKPEVSVFGNLASIKISMSHDDYTTVMSILSENLAETQIQEEVHPLTSSSARQVDSSVTKECRSSVSARPVRKISVTDILPQKVYTKFQFGFEMDCATVNIFSGATPLVNHINVPDESQSMAAVQVNTIFVEALIKSDDSITAQVLLKDFVLIDTRISRQSGVRKVMERTSKEGSEKMIHVAFNQDVKGEKKINVKVSSFALVVCLPYILQLSNFFSEVSSSEEAAPSADKGAALHMSSKVSTSQTASAVEGSSNDLPATTVYVEVEEPDIVLIEDIEDMDSNAIFLNNKIIATVTLCGTSSVISGKVENLTFYTACFNPEKRNSTIAKILTPTTIDLQYSIRDNVQHMDLLFSDLILHISPDTVHLIANILSALVTEKVAVDAEEKAEEDYSDLWQIKSLASCNFWFLENMKNDKAVEATDEYMETFTDIDEEIIPCQQALFTMRKIIITIEAGIGSRTVPMLLLESSFQAQICDWSSDISLESSLSVELSYYNEKIAVWEPVLEPIETSKGHRSWDLLMEMSRKDDDTGSEEDSEALPSPIKFEIRSDDILELTVSKVFLDVLTNLSQAFTDAVKQSTVYERKQSFAPYHVYNYLGIPITVVLSDTFQVLDAKQYYNEVILESGSPPLFLTRELSKEDSRMRLSMLKKQDVKEDVGFNIKIMMEDVNIERRISVACADTRFFELPHRTYPGDKWGFIIDIKSHYGSKIITLHSIIEVHNHFSVSVDIYYMTSSMNEVQWCGSVESNKSVYIPLHAVYTMTSELFFKPACESSYSMTCHSFVWKEMIENPSINKFLHCKCKDTDGPSFFMNVAGSVERVLFEHTNKKTIGSSLYKINLYPTVRLRNLLLYPINYSLQGIDKDFKLLEGETHELLAAEIGKTAIELRLLDYLDRDWFCSRILKDDYDELSVCTFETCVLDRNLTLDLGMHTQKINGSLVMELYSPFCMVNKTGLLLTYRGEEDVIYHPPDFVKPVLFSFKAKSFFSKKKASLKVNDSEWSDKFSIDAVGSTGNVVVKSKDGKTYGIGVQIKLSQTGLTKMVIFTPFNLVVNNCNCDLECKEVAPDCEWIAIGKEECVPYWPTDAAKSQMVVRYFGEETQTEIFSFKENHSTLLKLNSRKGGIHVDCQVSDSSVIITFEDYIPGYATAIIINGMADHYVHIKQHGSNYEMQLGPQTCLYFAWQDPLEKRILMWRCNGKKDGSHDLVKDGVGDFHPESDVTAYWLSFLDGMQRVLLFTDNVNSAYSVKQVCQEVRMDQEILVMLQGVGISLVDNDKKVEIMYMGITSTGIVWEGKKEKSSRYKLLSMKECFILEAGYQRYQNELRIGKQPRRVQTLESKIEVDFENLKMNKPVVRNLKRTFQTGLWVEYKSSPQAIYLHAKINRLQVDNQLMDCVFPVVIAPVAPPKSVAAESAPKPFTEFSIMIRKGENSAVQQIKYCKILVQEFHIKLDHGFINSMISYFTADQPVEINHVQILSLDKNIVNSNLRDVAEIYSSQEQKCYFDLLHFSPLKVHISFSMAGGSTKDDNKSSPIQSEILKLFIHSIGVTVTEIQDVIFKLDYFERRYTFMSTQQLINEAFHHYQRQAIKQAYMLIFGLDALGNPAGLILGLGEGVTDLFYEPFQGAIQGPDEFLEGLGYGVKSLFGHAVGGAAGAASRITGTLGKGIAALTLDKDYQRKRRQNLSRRPQDVTQGLAQSGKGLLMGVFDGITGIVRKPIEGAREEGVGGFFKGVGKGLIGVVTRPTAGVMDFASGSFDALKRFAEDSDEVKRLRPPRYIRADGIVRPYVRKQSEGNKMLLEVEKGKYASTDTYEGHISILNDKSFLIVTNNRIMYVNRGDVLGQWNTEWEFLLSELREVPTITEKGMRIMLKEPHKKSIFSHKIAGKCVHITNVEEAQCLIKKIASLLEKCT